FTRQISGAVTNPYFQGFRPIAELTAAPVLLVTRLDAPETATVRRMITDAIEAEKNGLWGRAYVDGTHETSGGKEVGDAWMRAIVDQCHKDGVPVVCDDSPAIFSMIACCMVSPLRKAYPCRHACSPGWEWR